MNTWCCKSRGGHFSGDGDAVTLRPSFLYLELQCYILSGQHGQQSRKTGCLANTLQFHKFVFSAVPQGVDAPEDGGWREIPLLAVKSGWSHSDSLGFHEGKLIQVLGTR